MWHVGIAFETSRSPGDEGTGDLLLVVQQHVNATHMLDDGQVSLLACRRKEQLGW